MLFCLSCFYSRLVQIHEPGKPFDHFSSKSLDTFVWSLLDLIFPIKLKGKWSLNFYWHLFEWSFLTFLLPWAAVEEFAASGLKINSFDFAANSLQNLEQVGNRRLPYKFMSKFKSFSLSRSLSLSSYSLQVTHSLASSLAPPPAHTQLSHEFCSFPSSLLPPVGHRAQKVLTC